MTIKKIVTLLTVIFALTITAVAQVTGNATYYADRFHGRLASDGTIYHRDSMTCAHKTYPFGTVLRVRNQKNGNEVYVKVTDRGPFHRGCIIDLSYAAASQLNMIADGKVPVELEIITPLVPFRPIENTVVPNLDLEKGYSIIAQNKSKMEKNLKEKASNIAYLDFAIKDLEKDQEPRYRIHRDILSAQNKKKRQKNHMNL